MQRKFVIENLKIKIWQTFKINPSIKTMLCDTLIMMLTANVFLDSFLPICTLFNFTCSWLNPSFSPTFGAHTNKNILHGFLTTTVRSTHFSKQSR